MATTDTVLQPGAEDLSGFTGPAGPTGPQGATGPVGTGADMNILSIHCKYTGIVNGDNSFSDSNFTATYLIENGAKYIAKASHTWTTNIGTNGYVVGTLSNFLVTATDTFAVQISTNKILQNGSIYSSNQIIPLQMMIQSTANNSLTWRLHNHFGLGNTITNIASSSITDIEFTLLITA